MKLVVYLSGRTGQTIGWHQMHDSVAASATSKGEKAARVKYLLESAGLVYDKDNNGIKIPAKFKRTDEPLYISPDALADLASDISENGALDAEIAKDFEYLCSCEALCGDIYLVGNNA